MRAMRHARRAWTWWKAHHQLTVLLVLAGGAALLQLLDGATALVMMHHFGPTSELNPLMRDTFESLGTPGVVLLKLVSAGLIMPAFVALGRRGRPILARNCLGVGVLLGFVGVLSNLP